MIKTHPVHHFNKAVSIALKDVMGEFKKAVGKHPEWPSDIIHQWAIVQEESGETQKEVLQAYYETDLGEDMEKKLLNVRKEAIQTAAMCLRFLAHLDIDNRQS